MFSKIKGEELDELLRRETDEVVLLSFSTRYSGEARMLDASVKELVREYNGKVQFFRIDADENADYIAAHGIHQLPSLLIYYQTQLIHRGIGLHSKSKLRRLINQCVSPKASPSEN